MTKVQIVNTVTKAFYKVVFEAKKHSPEILVGAGVIGTLASTALACKATLKVNDVVDEAKENIDVIHESKERGLTPGGQDYSVEDSKKDLAIAYVQTGIKFAKLYAPAVILGAASIGCIIKSHNILRTRNAALAAAYAAIDKSFKAYRGRVVEKFGKEIDEELRFNIKAKEIETTITDEKGNETVVKETVRVLDPNEFGPYQRLFDEYCPDWTKDAETNLMFVKAQQTWANRVLQGRKYLFLNEVLHSLGIPETSIGQTHGWIYDDKNPNHDGDNFVDFGILMANDFVNCRERSILLNFNCDGYILDKAYKI